MHFYIHIFTYTYIYIDTYAHMYYLLSHLELHEARNPKPRSPEPYSAGVPEPGRAGSAQPGHPRARGPAQESRG